MNNNKAIKSITTKDGNIIVTYDDNTVEYVNKENYSNVKNNINSSTYKFIKDRNISIKSDKLVYAIIFLVTVITACLSYGFAFFAFVTDISFLAGFAGTVAISGLLIASLSKIHKNINKISKQVVDIANKTKQFDNIDIESLSKTKSNVVNINEKQKKSELTELKEALKEVKEEISAALENDEEDKKKNIM